jgi:hypothetical protein
MKHELLSIVSSIVVASTTFADVNVLNFDDLVVSGEIGSEPGRGPLGEYGGFRFSSYGINEINPIYDNKWAWYGVNHVQSQQAGYAVGLRGEAALFSPYYTHDYASSASRWNITRIDGGDWHFFGAWFTSAWNGSGDLRIVGKKNGATQFDVGFSISSDYQSWLSYGAGYEIDTLTIWREYNPNAGNHFIMDDFAYSLVPAPGCLTLLLGGSLIRSRRRK